MLVMCDSFDHYTTVLEKFTANTAFSIGAFGRNGTNGARASGNSATATKGLPIAPVATLIVGIAVKPLGSGSGHHIFGFMDGGTVQVQLSLGSDGKLSMVRGSTTLTTGSAVLATNTYYYVECKVTINGTTGSYEVRVDGTTDFTATNQNTRQSGVNQITAIRWLNSGTLGNGFDVDDFYCCDTTGSQNNDFLGDVRIEAILPNGNGNSSQWAGSDGNSTDNYLLVDEAVPNGDTDHVQSATTGNKDIYAYPNITSTTGIVKAVVGYAYARKLDAGTRNIKLVTRPTSTDYAGTARPLQTTYAYHSQTWEQNPQTAAAWTISEVNAAEFGVEVA